MTDARAFPGRAENRKDIGWNLSSVVNESATLDRAERSRPRGASIGYGATSNLLDLAIPNDERCSLTVRTY